MIRFPHVHRKRPFLVRPLENTLIKLLKSLDFYDESGREKIAIGMRPQPDQHATWCAAAAVCSHTAQRLSSSVGSVHAYLLGTPQPSPRAPWFLYHWRKRHSQDTHIFLWDLLVLCFCKQAPFTLGRTCSHLTT